LRVTAIRPVCTRVQDAYSLRCSPQVHGAARDTVAHARTIAERELASAVDNPVVTGDGRVESNGNFHGAPVAYVLDFLAIAVADLASIAERRTDRALDRTRSHGLPPFLADEVGVDSGLMIAQYAAAGIVSELKRLAVPASVDSIPRRRCRKTTCRWDGPPHASSAAPSTDSPGCSRSNSSPGAGPSTCGRRCSRGPPPPRSAPRCAPRASPAGPDRVSPDLEAATALVLSGAVADARSQLRTTVLIEGDHDDITR
jgi:histidine ammonia-lyase